MKQFILRYTINNGFLQQITVPGLDATGAWENAIPVIHPDAQLVEVIEHSPTSIQSHLESRGLLF
jgi:hypothetical protein